MEEKGKSKTNEAESQLKYKITKEQTGNVQGTNHPSLYIRF